MRTSQLDPHATTQQSFPPCLHKRLIDRISTEDGKATSKFRCLECGATLDEQEIAATDSHALLS